MSTLLTAQCCWHRGRTNRRRFQLARQCMVEAWLSEWRCDRPTCRRAKKRETEWVCAARVWASADDNHHGCWEPPNYHIANMPWSVVVEAQAQFVFPTFIPSFFFVPSLRYGPMAIELEYRSARPTKYPRAELRSVVVSRFKGDNHQEMGSSFEDRQPVRYDDSSKIAHHWVSFGPVRRTTHLVQYQDGLADLRCLPAGDVLRCFIVSGLPTFIPSNLRKSKPIRNMPSECDTTTRLSKCLLPRPTKVTDSQLLQT